MFIEMKESIGSKNPETAEVIRQALLLGVQVKLDRRGGATLIRLESATMSVKDIPVEYFRELPGVLRIIPAIQLGW